MNIIGWDEADEIRWERPIGDPVSERAPDNAVIVLLKLEMKVEGDSPQDLPSYAPHSDLLSDISLEYSDEPIPLVQFGGTSKFHVNGDRRTSYQTVVNNNPGDIYPPETIEGWIGGIVSENYSPDGLIVTIEIEESSYTWTLSGERPTPVDESQGGDITL